MSNSKDYREELKSFIENGRNDDSRHLSHATYVVKTEDMFGDDVYGIQYHKTVIFGIRENGDYFFNNGGYFTVTTKKRINDALIKVGNYHQLVQRNHKWLLSGVEVSTGFMLFDVNNDIRDCVNIDCWGKTIQSVSMQSTKITSRTRKF